MCHFDYTPDSNRRKGLMKVPPAVSVACIAGSMCVGAGEDRLWSDKPVVFSESQEGNMRYAAVAWSQNVFPLGNGRIGCTVFGDPARERIQFNEDSLWVGNEDCTGGYQPFGDLYVQLGHAEYTEYRRELDISRAVQTVSYHAGGVNFRREYFASYPAQVMVFRFSADKAGMLSGEIWLDHLHRSATAKEQLDNPKAGDAITTRAKGNTLTMSGSTADLFWWQLHTQPGQERRILGQREYASDKNIDLDLEAQARVLHEGGRVKVDGDHIVFADCDAITILLGADTSYLNQRDKGWRGEHPHKCISAQLDTAAKRSYKALLEEHVRDYQSIYGRFELSLGDTPKALSEQPTASRLKAYQEQYKERGSMDDRGLEALIYQYARYLMISCSRPGGGALPANLQGLWLYHFRPAWRCDYHTDINLQMNYWFVDQANISECFTPLAEWLDSIRDVRKQETRKVLGVKRGWLMRSENGVFGGSTYHFQKGDSAWISQNLWDHFAFTRDEEYLTRYAYPVMKEICEFWLDHLKPLPNGKLVIPDGRSPEHGPEKSDGVSYDQQLCWDLFSNTIEASAVLGVDNDFRKLLVSKRDKLLGPKVGKWGQLQEWMADIDDPKNDHRHVSHMLAVYPGRQIHPSTTPTFAEAAKVSVIARGNGRTGWSKVFKSCVFGRLLEAEHAYRLLSDVILTKTHANLWTTHPPFQIDCNFGYAAAVNEMLAQSHMGEIHLLPALPKAWADGRVRGMKVRGGYELDMVWKDGTLESATLHGVVDEPEKCIVRYGAGTKTCELKKGKSMTLWARDQ
jgi:alpha-L-fucosidase 2